MAARIIADVDVDLNGVRRSVAIDGESGEPISTWVFKLNMDLLNLWLLPVLFPESQVPSTRNHQPYRYSSNENE